jgi:pyruvate kinase
MAVRVRAIVTVPPYARFAEEVARHPLVTAIRLNTVMPIKGPLEPVLTRLAGLGPPLWVDLKGRQLRVVGAAMPPFTEVRVSHPIRVRAPADAFFNDGREHARIAAVDGDRLILEDGPRRLVGPGESINIVDPSLEILGTLTETDRRYLAAMRELGLCRVMLSFAERASDAAEIEAALPGAEIILKIESQRGLDLARSPARPRCRLMAARGDLYVEVLRPHRILSALKQIIAADPEAIVASRLFASLSRAEVPTSADICDAAFLMELGYRTFMLGDEICLARDSVIAALNLLEAVAGEMG